MSPVIWIRVLFSMKKLQSTMAIVMALAYIVIRFFYTKELDRLGTNASYYFEVILVCISIANFWNKFKNLIHINYKIVKISLVSFFMGVGIYLFALQLGVLIPFNFRDRESLLFLLIIAPVLEELIFRFFIWSAIYTIKKDLLIALYSTSIIFSYSHFHSIWFVPNEYRGFIFFQSCYTLILGFACGYSLWRYNSLLGSILIHFVFNLGFYLGFVIS